MKLVSILSTIALSLAAITSAFGAGTPYNFTSQQPVVVKTEQKASTGVVLAADSVIPIRGEVGDDTVSKWIMALTMAQSNHVYLFIDSPGGSVIAGARFIDAMQASNKQITCVVGFAASMAFIITQACPERIIMPSSILMQHQEAFGLEQNKMLNQESFFNFLKGMINQLDTAQAKRIGISLEKFHALTTSDWWLFGVDNVTLNTADKVEKVSCSPELTAKTTMETFRTMFGTVNVTFSACPLISAPLKIEMPAHSEGARESSEWVYNLLNYRTLDVIHKINEIK